MLRGCMFTITCDRGKRDSYRFGQSHICTPYTVYERMYGKFRVEVQYVHHIMPIYVWFWPTLFFPSHYQFAYLVADRGCGTHCPLSCGTENEKKEKRKTTQAARHSLHQSRKRRHIGPRCRESPQAHYCSTQIHHKSIGLARTVYVICTPYMTVYLVISLPKMPYIHRIYMVLANPTNHSMPSVCPCFQAENWAHARPTRPTISF